MAPAVLGEGWAFLTQSHTSMPLCLPSRLLSLSSSNILATPASLWFSPAFTSIHIQLGPLRDPSGVLDLGEIPITPAPSWKRITVAFGVYGGSLAAVGRAGSLKAHSLLGTVEALRPIAHPLRALPVPHTAPVLPCCWGKILEGESEGQ